MINIHITDKDGNVLGSTMLDWNDLTTSGKLRAEWVGQKVLDELPSNQDALNSLLGKA